MRGGKQGECGKHMASASCLRPMDMKFASSIWRNTAKRQADRGRPSCPPMRGDDRYLSRYCELLLLGRTAAAGTHDGRAKCATEAVFGRASNRRPEKDAARLDG